MEKETKLLNPMKLRGDEYKGFAVDMKHGTPVEMEEKEEEKVRSLEEQDLRDDSYKGIM